MVNHRIDRDHPPPEIRLEYGAGVYIENKDDKLISEELFDGAILLAKYVKITTYVNDNRRVYSVHVSLVGFYHYTHTRAHMHTHTYQG